MATAYTIPNGTIQSLFNVSLKKTDDPGSRGTYEGALAGFTWLVSQGTGSGQIDDIATFRVAIATGGTESIDLSGTTYFNPWNVALAWAKLKAVILISDADNTTNVTPGGGANAVIASAQAITPGGMFSWIDPVTGLTVADGSSDILQLVNAAGATANVDVLLAGIKA